MEIILKKNVEKLGFNNEIVTVNGGHGTKNSSIIYLSPERSTPPRNLTTVTNDSMQKDNEPITETLIRIKRNGRGSQVKNLNSHGTTMVTVNDSKTDTTILPVTQDNNIKLSQKLTKSNVDYREESETDLDEKGDSNTERGDNQGDNDTVDTSDKETSADEVSDDSVLQSGKFHHILIENLFSSFLILFCQF
jgi:ribosomal protein L9